MGTEIIAHTTLCLIDSCIPRCLDHYAGTLVLHRGFEPRASGFLRPCGLPLPSGAYEELIRVSPASELPGPLVQVHYSSRISALPLLDSNQDRRVQSPSFCR